MFKKITAFIIAITIILVNTNNVNAGLLDIGTVITGLNGSFNLADSNEKKRSDLSNWVNQNSTWAGFMFDTALTSNYLTPSLVYSVLPQSVKDTISDSTDESEILNKTIDMILEGQSVSGNDITNNTNVNTFIKNISNQYVNDNKYYLGYSLDLQYYDLPSDINTFVQENDDELVFIKRHYNGYFVFTDNILNTNNYGFVYNSKGTEVYDTIPYNLNTFNRYPRGNPGYNNPYEDGVTVYFWQNGVFTHVTHRAGNYNTAYENFYFMERNYTYRATDFDIPDWTNNWNCLCVSYGHVKEIPIYGTKPLLESSERGTMPYYYNNTVWQDFSSSTGDYTFSPTNINTVTYGDTVSYINDYHDTNNNYPDNSTVNNWINNTNEENITNNGGGSGGDDSGSDSPSDIFGWLKQLGAVLGSLIKGVGEFLTEIVTGLVSAINNLLSGISDLIKNITESLPTVFMDFLGTLFSWLPDEWLALFSASIIFMLLWGIIKTIRGS